MVPPFSEIFLSLIIFAMISSTCALLMFFWKSELIACASVLCLRGLDFFSDLPRISSTRLKAAGSTAGFGAGFGLSAGVGFGLAVDGVPIR